MKDPLEELRKKFPGRKIDVIDTVSPADFVARKTVVIDQKKISASWSFEAASSLKALHGLDIDELLADAVCHEISKDINQSFPKLSPWKRFKNAVNYKRRR